MYLHQEVNGHTNTQFDNNVPEKKTWEPQTDCIAPLDVGAFHSAFSLDARENWVQTWSCYTRNH
jgi:hypothetical protein